MMLRVSAWWRRVLGSEGDSLHGGRGRCKGPVAGIMAASSSMSHSLHGLLGTPHGTRLLPDRWIPQWPQKHPWPHAALVHINSFSMLA